MKKATIPGYSLRYLYEQNGWFKYRRVIPSELRSLAGNVTQFKESLRTNSPAIVIARYGDVHAKYEAMMDQLRSGRPLRERQQPSVGEVRQIAKSYGVVYRSADELIEANDMGMMMERIRLWDDAGKPADARMDALFGTIANDDSLSGILDYYELHSRDQTLGLNDRQIAKKRNPVRLAVRRFRELMGKDYRLQTLTRDVANGFRLKLLDLVQDGQLRAASADKQIMHIRKIVTFYIESRSLPIANPFAKLSIKGDVARRPAFTLPFIKAKWFVEHAFVGLNAEARGALFAMLDTGCGPREISGLDPADIRLDEAIPHIIIRANEYRALKSAYRGRTIPLVGRSLPAMRDHPAGFPAYRGPSGGDNLSGVLMKYLRGHGLLETNQHSVYSLRHLFKDRMRTHGFPEELQKSLMGHVDREMGARYGSGYPLSQVHGFMEKLASDWD